MRKRKTLMDTARKVRRLRQLLGGRRAVVRVMRAASSTSLKRWERKDCVPFRAHVHLVDETYGAMANKTYQLAQRIGKAMLKKSRRVR